MEINMQYFKMILPITLLASTFTIKASVEPLIFDKSAISEASEIKRFRQHEVNQLMLDFGNGGTLARHLDAQISISYLLTEPDIQEFDMSNSKADWNLALAGTIEFDFFVGSRNSSPVVGRRYNPSLQYYYSLNQPKRWQEWRLSFEHESNGQSTDNIQTLNELARSFSRQYRDNRNVSAEELFDLATETISLSNNFVSVGGVYRFSTSDDAKICDEKLLCVDLHFKLRQQVLGDIQNGEFRTFENRNDRLKDYQGTKLSLTSRWSKESRINLTIRTGQLSGGSPLKNNTMELNYFYIWNVGEFDIPLSLSYRTGYLEELYNYSNKSSTLKIGLNFLY